MFVSFDRDAFTEEYFQKHIFPQQFLIDVENYTMDISIDLNSSIIHNVEVIRLNVLEELDTLVLNFYDNMKISRLNVNGNEEPFKREENHLFIFSHFPEGKQIITIEYSGKPENLGLGSFSIKKWKDENIFYIINEPVYAPTWFVCNDTPSDKAMFSVSIENIEKYLSISAGNLDSIITYDSTKKYFWSTNYSIPTYLLSIYSGPYNVYNDTVKLKTGNMELAVYTYNQNENSIKTALRTVKNSLKVFEELFGDYPFGKDKLAIVEIPWSYGGIENYSAIGIGSNFFSAQGFFNNLFVHEISHNWWGNSATLKSWKDIWLNEGFATYSEALYFEHLYGHDALISTISNMKFNDYENSISNPRKDALTKLTYFNAAWVLHQLRREVGDQVFFDIIRKYYNRNKYGIISTSDFVKLCEEISQKDLKEFFDQWLYRYSQFPAYSINIERKGKHKVNFFYKREEKIDFTHKLDVSFYSKNAVLQKDTTIEIRESDEEFLIRLDFPLDSVAVDPDYWLPKRPEIKIEGTF